MGGGGEGHVSKHNAGHMGPGEAATHLPALSTLRVMWPLYWYCGGAPIKTRTHVQGIAAVARELLGLHLVLVVPALHVWSNIILVAS